MRKARRKARKQIPGIVLQEVDNPLFSADHAESQGNPKRIKAQYNPRESPIAWMLVHKRINEAQARAGSRFRELFEASSGTGVQAMDYTKEPVDCIGGSADVVTDRRQQAAKELGAAKTALGALGYELVQRVCGECLWINQIETTKRRQLKAAEHLRGCLDLLSVHWGYQTKPVRGYRQAS